MFWVGAKLTWVGTSMTWMQTNMVWFETGKFLFFCESRVLGPGAWGHWPQPLRPVWELSVAPISARGWPPFSPRRWPQNEDQPIKAAPNEVATPKESDRKTVKA